MSLRSPTRFEQIGRDLGYSLPEALAVKFRQFCRELGEEPEHAFDLLDLVFFRSSQLQARAVENGISIEHRISRSFTTRCLLDFQRADAKQRTAELTLTSEEPIEDQPGVRMILDHRPQCVDLTRIQKTGSFLWNHDPEKPLGCLENVRLVGKQVRARARFALHDEFATRVWENVAAGIYRNTSARFKMHQFEYVGRDDRCSTYRCTSWELVEGSIVAVPADASVGVAA